MLSASNFPSNDQAVPESVPDGGEARSCQPLLWLANFLAVIEDSKWDSTLLEKSVYAVMTPVSFRSLASQMFAGQNVVSVDRVSVGAGSRTLETVAAAR